MLVTNFLYIISNYVPYMLTYMKLRKIGGRFGSSLTPHPPTTHHPHDKGLRLKKRRLLVHVYTNSALADSLWGIKFFVSQKEMSRRAQLKSRPIRPPTPLLTPPPPIVESDFQKVFFKDFQNPHTTVDF